MRASYAAADEPTTATMITGPFTFTELTYRKKKTHRREKTEENKALQWKALHTHLFNEEDKGGAFMAFLKNARCTNSDAGCT